MRIDFRGSPALRRAVLLACIVLSFFGAGFDAHASRVAFRNETSDAGLDAGRTQTWGQLWLDYNRDGWPDLFINRHAQRPFFYANRSGGYKRVYFDFRRPEGYRPLDGDYNVDRHGCAWGEATGDGRPDLYCTVGANEGTSVGPNQLLVRTSDGFRDVAARYGVRDIYGRGRTVNWLDHDSDGDLDLYVGNFIRARHPSAFFVNHRGRFRRRSLGLDEFLRTRSSSWADWDRDGDPDLLVMQWDAPAVAYRNVDGRFVHTSINKTTGTAWQSGAWGDYNSDGFPDLHVVSESRSLVLKNVRGDFRAIDDRPLTEGRMGVWFDVENDSDLDLFVVRGAPGIHPSAGGRNQGDFLLLKEGARFVPVSGPTVKGPTGGNGDTATTADSNRDGRMDVFVSHGYFDLEVWQGPLAYLTNRSLPRNYIALDLRGGPWNPLGIGARVVVRTPYRTIRRQITDGVVLRGQSEVDHVLVGIGGAPYGRVRVQWTTGARDCIKVDANQTAMVAQGAHPCA